MQLKYKVLTLALTLAIFTGCNNSGNNNGDEDKTGLDQVDNNEHSKKVRKIFYNVPSPIEMASLIQRSGAQYHPNILNESNNYSNYVTLGKQALNLGVYGTDLSYVRLFDQISLSIKYLQSIKYICDELNIPEAQGSLALSRLEENIENRDSILQIISETYSAADTYLKENGRGNTATMIILGGWVEALYIATNIFKPEGDLSKNEIAIRIAEQKYSLNNLIELVKSYPGDKDLQMFLDPLTNLQKAYDKVNIEYTKGDVVTDKNTKTTTINSNAVVSITKENINEIKKIILEIRTGIVN
jgi:hypothetical protein